MKKKGKKATTTKREKKHTRKVKDRKEERGDASYSSHTFTAGCITGFFLSVFVFFWSFSFIYYFHYF